MKPQYTEIDKYGSKYYYSDKELTNRHREDGPACEWADGTKEWWLNGERHREDGPAIECADGSKVWYLNGECHREDGPAIEYYDGSKEWYLNGERITEKAFNKLKKTSSCAGKIIVEIDGKKCKLIEQ